MSLQERVSQEIKAAMLAKDADRLSVLRMLKSTLGYVQIERKTETLSDATTGGLEPGSITFEFCARLIDDLVLVSEQEIREAMKIIAREENWIIEGAAGVAVASALKQKARLEEKKVAIILCGRNIDFDKYKSIICS